MATRLEKFYEDTFGTPQSRGELYTGFFLIVTGFVLTVAGIVIFGSQLKASTAASYNWREIGGVLAALGPPAIFVGISVALPTKWSMRVLDSIGVILCLAGTVVFVALYPLKWNTGTGDEIWGVIVYVAGLAALLASTIASLIGYYVTRATGGAAAPQAGGALNAPDYNYDIPDSVIEKDIELAMRRYNVSWGGEGSTGSKSIQLDVKDDFDAGTVIGGKGVARSVTLDAPQVDDATSRLRTIRGGKGTSSVESKGLDASTEALLKFRKQRTEQVIAKEQRRKRGFWAALKRLFGFGDKPEGPKPGASRVPPQK